MEFQSDGIEFSNPYTAKRFGVFRDLCLVVAVALARVGRVTCRELVNANGNRLFCSFGLLVQNDSLWNGEHSTAF